MQTGKEGNVRESVNKADALMHIIIVGLTVYSLALAPWYGTWLEAIVIGVGTLAATSAIRMMAPGSIMSRLAFAVGVMAITALNIHQSHGMIEFHFGIFALLAVLLVYRDPVVIVAATAVVAVHHISFYFAQTQGLPIWVLESGNQGWWIILLHAGYLIVECAVLVVISAVMKKEAVQAHEMTRVTTEILADDAIYLGARTNGATELLRRFDSYTESIQSLVGQVSSLTGELNQTSEQFSTLTDSVKGSVSIQKAETEKIASAIEEMSASSSEMSENAKVAANSALNANEDAANCRNASMRTDASIREMADKIREAVTTVTALNDQSSQIGSVVNVIRSVADQTNLLALNAAIEAARAGEQGRGFAVVADEVRTLAQRSQESTEDIDRMIDSLQSQSEAAVIVIESSKGLVEACVQNTQESLALMERVSEAITQINALNQSIANATHEQASVASEVSSNIAVIAVSGEKVLEQTHNASSAGATLHQFAQQLDGLNRKFNHR
ncbi:methyl-accepting chemotaxis protein [Halioxenophilus aromaticivorans]|uniref:Methyl-accepting chemotaxis protein n=1 Tax=Halioxenophilus aromaticivorans TaxID=1306992 RepID=A0AAV3TX95_9ALTE